MITQRIKLQRGCKTHILNDIFRIMPVAHFEIHIALKRNQIFLQQPFKFIHIITSRKCF